MKIALKIYLSVNFYYRWAYPTLFPCSFDGGESNRTISGETSLFDFVPFLVALRNVGSFPMTNDL